MKLVVSGSGKPLRQFVYAPDLAKLILWCLKNYEMTEPIILCPDERDESSISSIAEMIIHIVSKKFGCSMRIEYDTSENDGQYKKTASNRKLSKMCPDFQFTPLTIGLEEVVDWYFENYPNVRAYND